MTYREARGLKWYSLKGEEDKTWSACPHCDTRLTFRDLIPIVSWLLLKGRCRHCGGKISARYPVTELISVLACVGLYITHGFTPGAFLLMLLVPFLIALFFIDLDDMILPNRLVAICLVIAILYTGWTFYQGGFAMSYLYDALAGATILPLLLWAAAIVMSKILKKDALGMGDVKFLVPAGLLTGFVYLPYYLILAGGLGILSAFLLRSLKSAKQFPFGPALIAALYIIIISKNIYFSIS